MATLLPAERALILSHAREAGVESVVEDELATSRPLAEIVGGVTDDQRKRDLYVLAFTIVRADEHVSGAERIYLAQLAHQLGLDAATVAQLEARHGVEDRRRPGDATIESTALTRLHGCGVSGTRGALTAADPTRLTAATRLRRPEEAVRCTDHRSGTWRSADIRSGR